jgi:hypothetical protein
MPLIKCEEVFLSIGIMDDWAVIPMRFGLGNTDFLLSFADKLLSETSAGLLLVPPCIERSGRFSSC